MIRPIEYTVVLATPQTQTLQVRMLVRDVHGPTLEVALPAWRQGRYAILDPAGTLYNVRAETASGTPLGIRKTDKATWRITKNRGPEGSDTALSSDVLIHYDLYANSLNDRTRHVDETHAFLSGATVFLYVPERRNDAIAVRIEAPADWSVSCGLKHVAGDERLLVAPDFDTLIDSPIEAGIHDHTCFLVEEKPHDLVIWGATHPHTNRLTRDLASIIRTQAALWGSLPYERYVFMLHVVPGLWGGTEHLNSTIMQAPPSALENEDDYQRLLSLASHELFHTWNVKRLRPAVLRQPDLGKENYSDLLWFCEGTTSYYDDLLVVRAGLQSPEAYLASVAESIYQVRARPGSRVQSLAESSFDAWVKFNRPTANDMNATVSFYENGALFSLLWDLTLRSSTNNAVSLDTVLQEMYRLFPADSPGFSTADLIATTARLAGQSYDDFFARYVYGTDMYPLEDVFDVVGLRMSALNGESKPYLGVSVQDQQGVVIVRTVLSDGPAYSAGVNFGDEVVSMNNETVAAENFVKNLEGRYKPGDVLNLELRRRGRTRSSSIKLGRKPQPRWELLPVDHPTDPQRAAYRSWLHQDFPGLNREGV